MVKLRDAAQLFRSLNGVISVYKPPCVSVPRLKHAIITNLCRDLNALPDRPLEQRVEIEGPTNETMRVSVVPNYADHPLVCGARYIQKDFRISVASHLGFFTSGLILLGINEGTRLTYKIHAARPTRAYKVHGQFGKATDTYFWNGRTIERAMYKHVTREKIDQVIGHMQAAHQKAMFEASGVHIDSQAAFELASQGPVRPANNKIPVLYGIRCVHFDAPNFTLEIQSVNEYDKYLWTLIHELGIQLRTAAHCTGVQCIRQGKFGLDLALLRKFWSLEHIVNNINECNNVLEENEHLVKPHSAILSV